MSLQGGKNWEAVIPLTVLQIVLKPHGDNYDMVSSFPNDGSSALAPLIHVCSSSTVGEARASVDQLATLIRRLVETNQDMSQCLARMEMRTVGFTRSTAPTIFTANEHPSPIRTPCRDEQRRRELFDH